MSGFAHLGVVGVLIGVACQRKAMVRLLDLGRRRRLGKVHCKGMDQDFVEGDEAM